MTLRPSFVLPGTVHPGTDRQRTLLEIAEHLDEVSGWHAVFVPDTILALRFYESTVLLAALAARTRRIRLGVACLSTLGLRQPLVVAQQWAALDDLSGGRMTLIACPGNRTGAKHERERAAFGLEYDEKVERMLDALDLLRVASTNDRFSYHSPYLDLEDVELTPGFRQRPLPIWMVANPSPLAADDGLRRVLDRVARYGDGWLTYQVTPDLLERRLAVLQELRAARGAGGPFPVAVQVNLCVAPTREEAFTDAAAAWDLQNTRGLSFAQLLSTSAIGTPEDCAAFLESLHAAGATDVLLHPLSADPATQARRASRDVLPLLPGAPLHAPGPTAGVGR
ncbi:LLM class flavin-dependent oxidoreductase [Cellulomonas soli]|uniref:Luciferase-like domain-containing protein n=1 Tax=Cellulomonas soli TaxID=931535 RepID=A0A512PB51_9CELL|nr:LLM class flavin-dependent oxidoreductase [Cellulomonas soli]NYI57283.1 alkanesulfonate monooxygenase SsuD/methylene tetrahydromethanopterin reductase-like flavin-dependent oxidoreductase (luciferase family) [Cellulomonas soli]GEP68437.1 hypothetical protein CSO01_11520 [Cellulomonas soli]